MSEEIKDEYLEIDPDQLQDLLGEDSSEDNGVAVPVIAPIELDLDEYDQEAFRKGIHDYSYKCGVITSLLNVGVSEQFVLDLLLNEETVRHNIETARIQKDMNVEMSKNQKASLEKQEL